MIRKQIAFNSESFKEINELYQQAFPKNEQTDLKWLFNIHKGIIYGYYQDEKLIGFTILSLHQQMISILYLAVKEEYRNQGWGSLILEDLSNKYAANIIMLDIEQIKECSNKKQRMKRKQFYLKNGFHETKIAYTWQKEDYIILCKNGMINEKEFWNYWNTLLKEKK